MQETPQEDAGDIALSIRPLGIKKTSPPPANRIEAVKLRKETKEAAALERKQALVARQKEDAQKKNAKKKGKERADKEEDIEEGEEEEEEEKPAKKRKKVSHFNH